MSNSVEVPDKCEDWPFDAKAATISETNKSDAIRSEIDDIVGIANPVWQETGVQAGSFSKYEMVLLLLALGGPKNMPSGTGGGADE